MYHRKYFIKDLFSTRGLLNLFDLVQFESVRDFSEAIQRHWIEAGRNQHMIVKLDDYSIKDFTNILKQTELTEADHVAIDISDIRGPLEDVYDLLRIGKKINVYIDLDVISKVEDIIQLLADAPKEWKDSNQFIIKVYLNKNNFKNQLNSVIEAFMKARARFFKFFLDYESFSDLTFKDFEDLKFRLADLNNWREPTRNLPSAQIDFNFSSNCKTVVLRDSKLYINDFALRDESSVFDLTNKEDLTGEDIDAKSLAQLRSYIDLKDYETKAFSNVTGRRRALIDPYFNKKLTTSYIIIPPITKLMMTIFEGSNENR